jgi:hypothetical protein
MSKSPTLGPDVWLWLGGGGATLLTHGDDAIVQLTEIPGEIDQNLEIPHRVKVPY